MIFSNDSAGKKFIISWIEVFVLTFKSRLDFISQAIILSSTKFRRQTLGDKPGIAPTVLVGEIILDDA